MKIEDARSYNRIRWAVVLIYIVMTFGLSLLPLGMELNEDIYAPLFLVLVLGGTITILIVLVAPYFLFKRRTPVRDGVIMDNIVTKGEPPKTDYHASVPLKLAIYIISPFIIIMAISVFFVPDLLYSLIIWATVAFLMAILIIFGSLEVKCDRETLSFYYGPVGKKVPIADIKEIRATAVHPLKEFMGWGLRIGPDGTIGYIASGNVGVRLSIAGGKEYVLTVNDPQALVDYVRAVRKKAD